jgi:hypothetical protein
MLKDTIGDAAMQCDRKPTIPVSRQSGLGNKGVFRSVFDKILKYELKLGAPRAEIITSGLQSIICQLRSLISPQESKFCGKTHT